MRGNGPIVVVLFIAFILAVAFTGAFLAYNKRWAVEITRLENRIRVLEDKAGVPPPPAPEQRTR
ncbi:hypothetical protein [Roseiterribacter gracilis]|uniref:Uncharacterized protein n=1 Tax=Roseiterribacter gracilis TaxID=2812848 RepID=A0A8S8XA33_9PROT|nr:hypothetical protein TMPK1_09480 [Rhodospirillales bacterium TMPK1]